MMSKDIPDYMRGFDLNDDWGIAGTAAEAPKTPSIDTSKIASTDELKDLKKDVSSIKSAMNEIFQIVAEKDTNARFKELEKIILPFLYNLSKSDEPYIHWPNRGPIIKAQIDKILKLTRGKN
jgi:hypothetical protein